MKISWRWWWTILFGNGMIDVFTKIFQEKGGQEVSVVKYAPEPADLSGEASKLSAEVERLSASGETAVFAVAFLGDAQKLTAAGGHRSGAGQRRSAGRRKSKSTRTFWETRRTLSSSPRWA
ncbi:MAG: hypothetical protein V9G24_16355 [Rhodoblastus sp.]